jgi:hypothetical protein
MPFLGLGLHIGDIDADSIVGIDVGPDGVIQAESGAFLQTEDGSYLAFN